MGACARLANFDPEKLAKAPVPVAGAQPDLFGG